MTAVGIERWNSMENDAINSVVILALDTFQWYGRIHNVLALINTQRSTWFLYRMPHAGRVFALHCMSTVRWFTCLPRDAYDRDFLSPLELLPAPDRSQFQNVNMLVSTAFPVVKWMGESFGIRSMIGAKAAACCVQWNVCPTTNFACDAAATNLTLKCRGNVRENERIFISLFRDVSWNDLARHVDSNDSGPFESWT